MRVLSFKIKLKLIDANIPRASTVRPLGYSATPKIIESVRTDYIKTEV